LATIDRNGFRRRKAAFLGNFDQGSWSIPKLPNFTQNEALHAPVSSFKFFKKLSITHSLSIEMIAMQI
jgi:hypothetical protein